MRLTLLGTGTSQVSTGRVSASNHIEIGSRKILVDCGCGALYRLSQSGGSVKDIDVIFISHYHVDHISEICPILWALKYPYLGRSKKLQIVGPRGFWEFYQKFIEPLVFSKPFDKFSIDIIEIEDILDFGDFSVSAYSTLHTDESIAYRFTEADKNLVIGGDMGYDEGFAAFAKDAHLLVLECSYDNSIELAGHLNPKACGTIARKANAGKLIITHLYPLSEDLRLEQTKELFANTVMGEDLMEFELDA